MSKDKYLDKYVLLSLGFKENFVSAEESGDVPYIYFTKDLNEFDSLISNEGNFPLSGDEIFKINLFNSELGVCETKEEVEILYKSLTGKIIKNEN